jgi:Flp pilus assembly protein TadD
MTKLQPSSLLTAVVLGLVLFSPAQALATVAIRPNELTHPASTPSFMAQASAAQYLDQGIQLGQAGDDRGAEDAFRKAVQLDPNNAEAHANLGVALANQGKRAEAIAEFRQALRLNPNNSMAHNNLGTVLDEQGKLEEAIAEFRQALRLNPNDVVARRNLGLVLYKQGQREEAITEYRQALRLNPNYAEAHMNLGIVLLEQGKREEAIAEFKQARELFTIQGKTQEATQIDQGIQKMNTQDTNGLSSQGFSLRMKHSPKSLSRTASLSYCQSIFLTLEYKKY